uniref:EGF-like domain-containing protein n=1 Tax=Oryzias sinensis TaxID=183150 RepID=A0A8C7ZZG7_9TELE
MQSTCADRTGRREFFVADREILKLFFLLKKVEWKQFGESKMPQKSNLNVALLLFLLMFGIYWKHCDGQGNPDDASRPPDGRGVDGSAFFALRSCHQLLRSDSGEFFSPEYLCSNPPLWCNWTIQVDPGKRIHLHLEDLTPDEACQAKQDQIHVDDPAGQSGGEHKVLQKCWQEAKYTSSSNILQVVLLIGGWPSSSYRGFYGRYQAFGPPVVYNPREEGGIRSKESEVEPGLTKFSDPSVNSEQTGPEMMYDYYDPATMAERPWESKASSGGTEVVENHSSESSHSYQFVVSPPSSHRTTFRSGRGVALSQSDSAALPPQWRQQDKRAPNSSAAVQGSAEEAPTAAQTESMKTSRPDELMPADGTKQPEARDASDQLPSDAPDPRSAEQHPPPSVVEQRYDHREIKTVKNHTETLHLPGDHLFEVAIEVNFIPDLEESWDALARSLLLSLKALISKHLDILHKQLTLSSKRIKRLNAGALYILWLQIGQGPGGGQVHRAVHSAMQGLLSSGVNLRVNRKNAIIMSVSTADVNECGTNLVLCDANADCVNHFGSYSCHCREGFKDESRLGSGGTICTDQKTTDCSSGLSSETKGVYILFFLLSSLILMLVAVAGTLYHRHHRGAFLVRCHNSGSISPPDSNNNHLHHEDHYSSPADSDLPPPPPPARGSRDSWAPGKERRLPVDLPLLRFSPLLPPDSYIDPQDGGKM